MPAAYNHVPGGAPKGAGLPTLARGSVFGVGAGLFNNLWVSCWGVGSSFCEVSCCSTDSDDVPAAGDAIFSSDEDVVQKGNDLRIVSRHSRVQCARLVDDLLGFAGSPKTHYFLEASRSETTAGLAVM